ncbi:MAG: MMPL family transporter [Thalassolituus sp.]
MSPEQMRRIVSPDYRYARLSLRVPMREGKEYLSLINYLESSLASLNSENFAIQVTGQPVIMAASHTELIHSASQGYGLSFLVLISIMMLFTRSVWLGALLMIPNLLPLFLVVACMPLLNIPLDILSMLVVSVAMGLVVDDTVHITAAFRQRRLQGASVPVALEGALSSAGRALFLTTIVLVAGFQVLVFSNFESVFTFGWLTSAVMLLGLVADLLVAPAILVWLFEHSDRTESNQVPAVSPGFKVKES